MSISRIKVLSRNTLKLMHTTLSYTAPQASTNIIHPRRTRIFSCLKTSPVYSKANCFTFRVARLCAVIRRRIRMVFQNGSSTNGSKRSQTHIHYACGDVTVRVNLIHVLVLYVDEKDTSSSKKTSILTLLMWKM